MPTAAQKYGALATLVLQNSLLILTMRYSRSGGTSQPYSIATATLLNEIVKLFICSGVAVYQDGPTKTFEAVFMRDHWKMAVPAALYTLQNTLQYVAVSQLEATTFQVSYQLKILTTAFFTKTMLHRNLHGLQWFSLVVLMAGVAIVQLPSSFWTQSLDLNSFRLSITSWNQTSDSFEGLVAVFTACLLSGLAGVYFEKVLKNTTSVSLWVRNIQLSFYSIWPALFIGVGVKDYALVKENGFWAGYNQVVATVIMLQAVGGIIVALCVNYADNIAKNFATSISIVVTAVVSVFVFKTEVDKAFLIGASLVIGATFLYTSGSARVQQKVEKSETLGNLPVINENKYR